MGNAATTTRKPPEIVPPKKPGSPVGDPTPAERPPPQLASDAAVDELPAPLRDRADDVAGSGTPPTHDEQRDSRWFSGHDQRLLAVLCVVVLLLMFWHWARLSGWGLQPVEIDRHPTREYEFRIDINKATWVEWVQLPGIGESLADNIVEYRENNGPFQRIDDLQNVSGIGPKTIEKLRPYLRVNATAGRPGSARQQGPGE